ncbi:hypothetical protein [Dyella sp. 2RAB6]|uniref:hypothetical protein n=1 Tax=Dyella sp. 2RAB6 TaxID=3232992 RepID=UPI003F8F38D7
MADIDSNSLNNFMTALNKASKSLGDMQKAVDAATKSAKDAGKAADGAAKEAAKPESTEKAVSGSAQKIKDDFAKDLMAALSADGKAARDARMKARDDLYNDLKRGVADTTSSGLADAARTSYDGDNKYTKAFLGAFAKNPEAAAKGGAATDAGKAAGDAGKTDSGKTEDEVAKSTDFMVDLAAQAGERIRGSLGTMLYDTLDGNFKNVGKSFRSMLRQMLADAAASQISKLAGSALGLLGNVVGGLFNNNTWSGLNSPNILGGDSYLGTNSTLFNWTGGAGALSYGVPAASSGFRAFARGGIVNSPTLFPMATGTGLMGEAGPEAIMPLARGPDGRLGVRNGRSSSGGGVNNQISITVNVGANGNAQSDTQAQSDDAGRQLASMVEGKVKEVMAREQRQGGILWRMQHA